MKVLEIGSSTGAFLEICSKECNCSGVEPASDNRRYSTQFATEVYSNIDEIPKSVHFDIVCLFQVFEHFQDPCNILEKIRKLLGETGLIVTEVPYIEDPLLSIYNLESFKDFYFQPMHPFVYSLQALRFIFEKNGFIEKEVVYYQRYGLDNHLAWLKNQKPGGDPKLSSLIGKNDEYRKALQDARKTDTIFYIVMRGPQLGA